MEIRKIARKLEPFMPDDIARWLRILDSADAKDKIDIESTIVYHATQILGDYNKKMLLSLPPEEDSKGAFELGTILYEEEKWPFALSENELLQNMSIFGRSGAGKTNLVFYLVSQLIERKIPFLFLDWKRTARHLIPMLRTKLNIYTAGRNLSPLAFNPFYVPPGLEAHIYIQQVVDVLASAFTLGEGSKSLLQKALATHYEKEKSPPDAKELLSLLDKLEIKGRAYGWKLSAERALESVFYSSLISNEKHKDIVKKLLHENTVIELDGLAESPKKFLIPILCLWIYYIKLNEIQREKLNLVIVIEEAHHVLYSDKRKESIMEMLLRQCRELGIAFIVIDQHPNLISTAALGNTYTSICLNLKDPSDINKAGRVSMLDEDEKDYISMLPIGQGIVKLQDRWRMPFLIQIPHIEIQKGAVTDAILKRYLEECSTHSLLLSFISRNFGGFGQFPLKDNTINAGHIEFLRDILKYPYDGVSLRYNRLGFGGKKGNKLKEELIVKGFVKEEVIPIENTRKVLLVLEDNAKKMLGIENENSEIKAESMAHEYWKNYYARYFKEKGYSIQIEARRIIRSILYWGSEKNGETGESEEKNTENEEEKNAGRIDVVARRENESVAVEIETGKSDAVWNVKQDLLARFRRILVVATDKAALVKVERELARAGLLGLGGRVELKLAGEKG